MSNWQERITQDTPPAIRVEHELRYRLAAPLIHGSGLWADLGCGNGVAAAAAIGDAGALRVVLSDLDRDAVERAAQALGLANAALIAADLTDATDLGRIEQALRELGTGAVVTCFEVVEHLQSFLPLLRWADALAASGEATFLLSVPNDAFWSIDNPHHTTVWSEGAFDELRALLPAGSSVLRQVAISGSVAMASQAGPQTHEITVEAGGDSAIATHFIVAFGPRHGELAGAALAVQTPVVEQRRWERQRDSNLAIAERVVQEQSELLATQADELRAHTGQFDEWRAYIHDLERQLGLPLSGSPERVRHDAGAESSDRAEPQP